LKKIESHLLISTNASSSTYDITVYTCWKKTAPIATIRKKWLLAGRREAEVAGTEVVDEVRREVVGEVAVEVSHCIAWEEAYSRHSVLINRG
jgi:hypothetical protein